MTRRKNYDYLISLTILIFSSIGSALTYAHISSNTKEKTITSSLLPLGREKYKITSEGACIGIIDSALDPLSNSFSYKANGSIRAKIKGIVLEPKFTVDAQFNSIGQLGASVLRINIADGFVAIGTNEINPITVRLRVNIGELRTEHSLQIPGPIELKRKDKDNFQIIYSKVNKIVGAPQLMLAQPFTSGLKVALEKRERESPECTLANGAFIDIDRMSQGMQMLVEKLDSWVP